MLRVLAYDALGQIHYKTDITSEYQPLPQKSRKLFKVVEPGPLHSQQLPISKMKYNHLQDLKKLLPNDCHSFYENLPFVKQ